MIVILNHQMLEDWLSEHRAMSLSKHFESEHRETMGIVWQCYNYIPIQVSDDNYYSYYNLNNKINLFFAAIYTAIRCDVISMNSL